MSSGRYEASYDLLREILADSDLNEFVQEHTGKALTLIDSGPKLTTPAAGIYFDGTESDGNSIRFARYTVTFLLPLFGANCMKTCLAFLDVAAKAFLKQRSEIRDLARTAHVVEFRPRAIEEEFSDKHCWQVGATVLVVI